MSKFHAAENKITCPQYPLSITPRASSARRNEIPMVPRKKARPRLITLSSSDGKWHGKWNRDFIFSLQDLQLHDLSDKDDTSDVSINLCVHKHAGLGMSVEGRITACFATRCCNCCSPYSREIDTTFKVWILPSTKPGARGSSQQLPDIGGDDPSVIYVKPGHEADLDSFVQDTIRLATAVQVMNETCSFLRVMNSWITTCFVFCRRLARNLARSRNLNCIIWVQEMQPLLREGGLSCWS